MEASIGCGEWKFVQMFQVTWPCPYIVKNFKIFFFGIKSLMTIKLGIQHLVLEYYQYFHMMTLVWPWPFLWQGQICFRMLLHGWKLLQHWVLMYFQVWSNWAYPQHSGERYRTSGPLVFVVVFSLLFLYPRHLCRGVYSFPLSVRPFVCSFVRLCIRHLRGIYGKVFHRVACKFFNWSISHEPLIRKHSYLDHRYPGGLAFIPWLLTPWSMPQRGARGQNLGHL